MVKPTNARTWAQRQADLDVAQIKAMIATTPYDYEAKRSLLLDGSQYSPSWRALPGGAAVWKRDDDVTIDMLEVYDQTLDANLPEGCYWEDGMLFYTKGQ